MTATPEMFTAVDNSLTDYTNRAEKGGTLTKDEIQKLRAIRVNSGQITDALHASERLSSVGSGYAVSDSVWDAFVHSGEFERYL